MAPSTTTLSLFSSSLSLLTKPTFLPIKPRPPHLRILTRLSSSKEFNITFGSPAPTPKPVSVPDPDQSVTPLISETGTQVVVPWIVRGEDGNLRMQANPPDHLVKAMALSDVKPRQPKKKSKSKEVKSVKGGDGSKGTTTATTTTKTKLLSKAARRFYNEKIKESGEQRLSKVLAAAGVASRRSCEELIFEGKVTVNGSVCNAPQTRVDPQTDVIYVNGNRLPKRLPPKVYFALNKPKGYICSAGEKETKSVLSLFDDYMKRWEKTNSGSPRPRLFTVGRLDVNTSGLIIVTNDGNFAQAISHPSHNLSKEYIATVDGEVNKRHLLALSEGTVVDGVHCTPDSVELLLKQPDMSRPRLRIVVHEGRNHEVRELVKNAGLEIHALKRVRIGGFRLTTDLGLGKHVELKPKDLQALGWKS